jgi:hypothetical protein
MWNIQKTTLKGRQIKVTVVEENEENRNECSKLRRVNGIEGE